MLKAKLKKLFAANEIGLYPVQVDNGADEYHCPGCDAYKPIKGHAFGNEHITYLEHRPNCGLYELYQSTLDPNDEE
jgi:hypothetical protein